MYTPAERAQIRSDLLERAASDHRIAGAAITGSGASGQEDEWSDIDLAFAVADAPETPGVMADWSKHMYDQYEAVHHFDVRSGEWIYRVFLLLNTLQVDLAFVPAIEFRAIAPSFQLIFGTANEPRHVTPPPVADVIGLGWLYALHVRSCVARGKYWQAEYMISGVRDNALALACVRHGLPAAHGRGIDQLPAHVTAPFEGALVRQLERSELVRAFQAAIRGFLVEIRRVDLDLAERLQQPLLHLSEITGEPVG